MVKPFANEPLSFPPGQQFDYSNAGFILLGAIIEKASGQSYYDYVRDHIFRPADMTDTDFFELDTDPPNLAAGFKDGPSGTRLNNLFDLEVKGSPAGMAYSTGQDMTKFHMALIHRKLVSEQSLQALWTGVTEEPERHAEYGYGTQIEHYNGTRIIWHGGGWKGVTDQYEMYPELGYTVVILSNYDSDPGAVAKKLREWLTQGTSEVKSVPPTPPALTLTAQVSAATLSKGTPITIKLTVKNSGGTAHASLIDMEVKDAVGAKANQQFTMGQKIDSGQSRTYTYSWTPTVSGHYTLDLGAFGPGWTPKYRFESAVATITVK
jgi:CubicO group peptidase (beta-lactamase class C family)